MSLKTLADEAVSRIVNTVSVSLPESDVASVSQIIEDALIKAVNQTSKNCATAAVVCCGPEADLAHKIAEEVNLAQDALIANLLSMR